MSSHRAITGIFAFLVCTCSLHSSRAANPSTVPPQGLRENTPTTHAFTNARIVVSPQRTIERGTLVIRDGVILAVGAHVSAPPDAKVWNLDGKTVYAGLIDAYSELSPEASKTDPALAELVGAKYWNSQIVPQLRGDVIYKPDPELNKKLRQQGFVARLAAPSLGLMKGTGALVSTSDATGSDAILRSQVTQHVALTPQRGRREDDSRPYPTSPMGAFTLVRQALYDAQWYRDAQAAWIADPALPRPESNDALEALSRQVADDVPFVIDASDELFALRADQIADEFKLRAIIRGNGKEYRRVDEIAKTGRAVIVPVNFPRPPNVTSPELALSVSPEDLMDWDIAPENPARLAKANVKISFTADGLRDKATFLAQVRKAVARGLSPQQALAAVTVNPAELLGIGKRSGTLEPGKSASFVITDGDLFAEKTKVLETWVEGKRFEVVSQPVFDVRGTWRATLQTDHDRRDVVVTIKGELEKLSGKIRFEGELPATQPSTQPTTQSTTQPNRELDLGNVSLRGTRVAFTFKSDVLARPGVAQASASIASVDRSGNEWMGTGIWPDGSSFVLTAMKSDAPSTDVTTQPTTKPETKNALFAVNYPLGEFGRQQMPEQESVLLTNATVWTCGPAGVLENAHVLIENGKITKVGNDDWYRTAIVRAKIVDCLGKHITPGIIDCHSHIATDGGINESGQAVTAEVRIGDFINPDDISIYRQLAGGVTSANILHGSANPIGGQNQVIKMRWGASPEAMKFASAPPGIKFALGENVKQSNWDIPDDQRTRYPQTRMGVEQIIFDEFRAAQDYKARQQRWQDTRAGIPPRRDLELDAIVEILDGQRWIHCHSYRQDEILMLMRLCEQFGITIGTFQHILEGYKVADAMAKHGVMGSSFSDWWAYKFEVYDAIPYNGALMRDAGVVVSYNSDDAELGRRLNLEAAKAMKYGNVPAADALKFVTLNPAKQLRIDKWVGSIEEGKDADIVVWSKSPLSTFTRCEQTFVDGRKYFDRAEDARLRQEAQDMRVALIQRILQSGEVPAEPGENEDRQRTLWPDEDVFCTHAEHRGGR